MRTTRSGTNRPGGCKSPRQRIGSKACLLITEKKGLTLSMTTYGGNSYNGHLLNEAKEKAEKNIRRTINKILADRGFRKHDVENAEVLISCTQRLRRHLKKALRRRQAIELWIGHMKQEGQLDRYHLKEQRGIRSMPSW